MLPWPPARLPLKSNCVQFLVSFLRKIILFSSRAPLLSSVSALPEPGPVNPAPIMYSAATSVADAVDVEQIVAANPDQCVRPARPDSSGEERKE